MCKQNLKKCSEAEIPIIYGNIWAGFLEGIDAQKLSEKKKIQKRRKFYLAQQHIYKKI